VEQPVHSTVLPGGTRLVSEQVPGARSASVGVWVGVGSRDESAAIAGVSHFLEHLLFKGTHRRSARATAVAVEAVGGDLNAYTAKEHTTFHLRAPTSGLGPGLDVLAEQLCEPLLAADDVVAERSVVLEELAGCDDAPEDVVDRLLWERLFPGHPLGGEVMGTSASVAAMTPEAVTGFFTRWYQPANLVIAAAGGFEEGELYRFAARIDAARPAAARPERPLPPPATLPDPVVQRRRTEQGHLCFGWRTAGHFDADRGVRDVLEQVLGGGPASRLFQEVREERALAYAVYASATEFTDSGALAVYAGVNPGRAAEATKVIRGVVEDLAAGGMTEEELATAKGYLSGSYWLGLEDFPSRMTRLGWWQMVAGRIPPPEYYPAMIDAVTSADVARVAAQILTVPPVCAAVGPFRKADVAW
jgi:predicted Zn-dependent peptidase